MNETTESTGAINPILVEAWRGGIVESLHRGAIAVAGPDGALIEAAGDVARPVFPRSAKKLIQALALVETGAADAHRLDDRHLGMTLASHSGEARHVATVREMLAAAAIPEAALGCGPSWPSLAADAGPALAARGGRPSRIRNVCSGKHAGFLLTARRVGAPIDGYLRPDHAVQIRAADTFAELTGGAPIVAHRGVDGCSAPTHAAPLEAIASAFARLMSGETLHGARKGAAARLIAAAMKEPWTVAGARRACTRLMAFAPGFVFAKTGAEGVYVAGLPSAGVALALKIDDGATRAAEAAVAAALRRLARRYAKDAPEALDDGLSRIADAPIRDFNRTEVGRLRAVAPAA